MEFLPTATLPGEREVGSKAKGNEGIARKTGTSSGEAKGAGEARKRP